MPGEQADEKLSHLDISNDGPLQSRPLVDGDGLLHPRVLFLVFSAALPQVARHLVQSDQVDQVPSVSCKSRHILNISCITF